MNKFLCSDSLRKILAVDDSVLIRQMVSHTLKEADYQV
ncbi:hypothetical protein BTN50_0648 [Candidatus Enterovibrio altilux]|uniref:Response regulatory domain-containing protein n=1 Tax=Candidatus Enterovibrio altilux TaxID=1927128 RepID=A0A291B861_9GAMM|nr:hypothetical protein BTN50_0648 [Candidatus Enterovibrio luxaltus]